MDDAEIFFGEEGVRSDQHRGTTLGVKGKSPIVLTTGARFDFNIISASSACGSLRFLIVESRPARKAKRDEEFVASTDGHLRLYRLPPYSPDPNPEELILNSLKTRTLELMAHFDKLGILDTARKYIRKLQRRPDIVRGFFQKEPTKYRGPLKTQN